MQETNNPVEGTGLTVDQTASKLFAMMGSDDATTQDVDTDDETLDVSNTVDEDEASDEEHTEADETDEDSTNETSEVDEDGAQDKVEPETGSLDDNTLVDVQGEKISLKELREGHMRRADYTRKTQELSEHKARYHVQEKGLDEIRAEALKEIRDFKVLLNATLNLDEPNWDELAQYDQAQYIQKRHEWNKKQEMVHGLWEREQQFLEKNKTRQAHEFAEKQQTEWKSLTEIHPEFAEPQKGHALLTEIGKFLANEGFSNEEIESIADHRVMKLAYRAFKAGLVTNKVEQAVKKTKAEIVAPVKSQKADLKPNKSKDLEKLRRSGTTNGVAAWIEKSF